MKPDLVIFIFFVIWIGYWFYAHWNYLITLKNDEKEEWVNIGSPILPSLRLIEHAQLGKYKNLNNIKLEKYAKRLLIAHSIKFYLVGIVALIIPVLLINGLLST